MYKICTQIILSNVVPWIHVYLAFYGIVRTPRMVIGGGVSKPKNVKESMKLNWRGVVVVVEGREGFKPKILLWGGYGYFLEIPFHTNSKSAEQTWLLKKLEASQSLTCRFMNMTACELLWQPHQMLAMGIPANIIITFRGKSNYIRLGTYFMMFLIIIFQIFVLIYY